MLTHPEERELVEAYVQENDQRAFKIILMNFEPMLRKIAKTLLWQRDDYDKLMQVGAFALCKAVRKYDASRGNRLAPLAQKLIRAEMLRYRQDNVGPVQIVASSKIWMALRLLPQAVKELRRLGHDPYGAPAIGHLAHRFRIDRITAKSLLATIHAGAHATVLIGGIDGEHTESAYQELWVGGGQSEVDDQLDNAKIKRSIVCLVHETHWGMHLEVVIEIVESDLNAKDFLDIAKRFESLHREVP